MISDKLDFLKTNFTSLKVLKLNETSASVSFSSSVFCRSIVSGQTEGLDFFDDPLSDGSAVGSDDPPGHQVHLSS